MMCKSSTPFELKTAHKKRGNEMKYGYAQEIIAQTEHVVIMCYNMGNTRKYTVYMTDIGYHDTNDKHEAFAYAREWLTFCKKNNLFPDWEFHWEEIETE